MNQWQIEQWRKRANDNGSIKKDPMTKRDNDKVPLTKERMTKRFNDKNSHNDKNSEWQEPKSHWQYRAKDQKEYQYKLLEWNAIMIKNSSRRPADYRAKPLETTRSAINWPLVYIAS